MYIFLSAPEELVPSLGAL